MKEKPLIFLSYTNQDERKVEKLYYYLSHSGFLPWMRGRDLLPGEKWKETIKKNIRQADYFLACMSSHSKNPDRYHSEEIRLAPDLTQNQNNQEGGNYGILLKLEKNVDVSESLSVWETMDYFSQEDFTLLMEFLKNKKKRTIKEEKSEEEVTRSEEKKEKEILKFHSGKRLALARNLSGLNQEDIIENEGFPFIDVRTLRRWESDGIPKKRISEVAKFFRLSIKLFCEEKLTEIEFEENYLDNKMV